MRERAAREREKRRAAAPLRTKAIEEVGAAHTKQAAFVYGSELGVGKSAEQSRANLRAMYIQM